MNDQEKSEFIWTTLTDIFRDLFEQDDLTLIPNMTADSLAGWDSFRHVEILIEVQDIFGVHFSSREIDTLDSVGDLAQLIASKGAVRGS